MYKEDLEEGNIILGINLDDEEENRFDEAEIGAIEARFNTRFNREQRRRILDYARKKAKRIVHKTNRMGLLTRGQKYLQTVMAGKFRPNSKNAANAGNLEFDESCLYIRKKIAGGGSISVITPSEEQEAGVMNFEKGGKVPDNMNVAIERIEIGFGNATVTDVGVKGATYAPIASGNTDTTLENSELHVTVDNHVVRKFQMNQFKEEGAKGSPANGINLQNPIALYEGDKVQLEIVTPDGKTLAATSGADALFHYIEFKLRGNGTSLKKNSR